MAEDPGKATVGELIKAVDDGKYVIPYFQRGFEWQPSMVSDLFESILWDYFAGLLLFWELDKEQVADQVWDSVWGAEDTINPNKAILDGQQRISSLYYAISNPEEKFPNRKTYYRWYLDLTKCLSGQIDGSVSYTYSSKYHSLDSMMDNREAWIENGSIPLSILSRPGFITSNEMAEWFQRFVTVKQEEHHIPEEVNAIQVSNRLQSILNYEFITTTLGKNREMRDICNIFARINKKGLNLSTFDLMNAFLYPHKIKLRKRWEDIGNNQLKSVDVSMNEYTLKLMSLHVQNYCSSKYIYNLIPGETTEKKTVTGQTEEVVLVENANAFNELWEKGIRYGEMARERIMNVGTHDFGAIKSKFIPNTTIVPVLGAILWEKENQGAPEAEFNELLARWYWSATHSGDYSGSSDTTMAKDFRDWKQWFNDRTPIGRAARVDEQFVENELDFRRTTRGTQYNAVLCMLALNGARDFFTGRPLNTGEYMADRIDDHHIFPSRVEGLDPDTSQLFDEYSDSILNRTLLLDHTNKHKVGHKRPSEYLEEMLATGAIDGETELEALMEEHFISGAALECLINDDFDGFINEREKMLKKRVLALVSP